MLLHDLFIVDGWQPSAGALRAQLRLRVSHRIFAGHFPGRPVLPGVCLVQLVQELAASVAGSAVRLVRAGPIKFITMIDPDRDAAIIITLTGKEAATLEWEITAEGSNAGGVCFKFKGVFREGSDYVA
jgi:3-hydroxyacyl-[acyl-carrier-protein] dehydratase